MQDITPPLKIRFTFPHLSLLDQLLITISLFFLKIIE